MVLENYITNEYLRAGVIFFGLFLILRIALFIIQRIVIKITSKTKTDIDDILVAKSSKPLTFISLLISLLFAIREITFPAPIKEGALSTEMIVLKIIYTLLAISIGYLIFVIINISLIRVWKKLSERTESDIDDTIGQLVYEVLRIALIVIIAIYILNIWGVEIGPFLAGLGIAGLAVALALQPMLSNIFSGVAIIIDGTFKVGDVIKLQSGEMGTVFKIGLRTTRIKTFDNELLIIPNSNIANSLVQNFYQPNLSAKVNVEFGVEYGVDPEYIKKIVIEEIEKIKFRNKDEDAKVLFTNMADSALTFKVMFWVDDMSKKWPAHQEAMTRIYRRLYSEKIGIPYPQTTVWLRDEGKAKSPEPTDKQFSKHNKKFYPSFGYEYKEKVVKEEKKEDKEKVSDKLLKKIPLKKISLKKKKHKEKKEEEKESK